MKTGGQVASSPAWPPVLRKQPQGGNPLRRKLMVLIVPMVVAGTLAVTPAPSESYYLMAKRVVHATFPDATQDAALRVVGCETGGTYSPWAYNPSGASGWFQVLQGNAGRVLTWKGHGTYTIPGGRKLFLPWTNTKVAVYLSKGGTDWHEWSCQP